MLTIQVYLDPFGDESKRTLLAEAVITNDGTGTVDAGNYVAGFGLPDGKIRVSRVTGYQRRKHSVWELLRTALVAPYKLERPNRDQG